MKFKRWLIERELVVAAHFGAFGQWWFASASRRLRKLSGQFSGKGVLK